MQTVKELKEAGHKVAYCKWCGSIVYRDESDEQWLFFRWIDDALDEESTIDALPDVNCGCNGLY